MRKTFFSLLFALISTFISGLPVFTEISHLRVKMISDDSIDNQILYNGRLWQKLLMKTDGDEFFLASDFLPGVVTINNKSFNKVQLKYDVFKDELLILKRNGTIILMNKEIVNSFSLTFNNEKYFFTRFADTVSTLKGYVNVLYDGDLKVYAKYRKEILPPTITNGLAKFNQINQIYIKKENDIIRINSKRGLLGLLGNSDEIKDFIRVNRIRVSVKNPVGFKRVVEFYESLK
jgi:hypothetical protein